MREGAFRRKEESKSSWPQEKKKGDDSKGF